MSEQGIAVPATPRTLNAGPKRDRGKNRRARWLTGIAGLAVVFAAAAIALLSGRFGAIDLPESQGPELRWNEVGALPTDRIEAAVWTGDRFLVSGSGHLFSSLEGSDWTEVALPIEESPRLWATGGTVLAWSADFVDLAGGGVVDETPAVFRSTNGGETFEPVEGLANAIAALPDVTGQIVDVSSMAVHRKTTVVAVSATFSSLTDLLEKSPNRQVVDRIREGESSADGYSVGVQDERLEFCTSERGSEAGDCVVVGIDQLGLGQAEQNLLLALPFGGLVTLLVSVNGGPFEAVPLGPAQLSGEFFVTEHGLAITAEVPSDGEIGVGDPPSGHQMQLLVSADGQKQQW